MSNAKPTIGILAGMGPRSTSPFIERVLDACMRQYGATADADYPPMMVYSLPTPFTLDAPLDDDAMRDTIRDGLHRLVDTGVDVVAIPCNVAHVYFADVVEGVGVPVLHLIETTAAAVPPEARAVAVLATRPTMEAGLYQQTLRARGLAVRDAARYQHSVDALIGAVKAAAGAEALDARWEALAHTLLRDGIDCVILGSTDLSAVPATARERRLAVVDSGAALAATLVRRWRMMAGVAAGARRSPAGGAG